MTWNVWSISMESDADRRSRCPMDGGAGYCVGEDCAAYLWREEKAICGMVPVLSELTVNVAEEGDHNGDYI